MAAASCVRFSIEATNSLQGVQQEGREKEEKVDRIRQPFFFFFLARRRFQRPIAPNVPLISRKYAISHTYIHT